ncbi:MAG: WD40 repeat domain-containing protein, partial [Gemmataceae bacterium]|nr:WD40 repeat domain-containing protein [Gemmataceae bacterium]
MPRLRPTVPFVLALLPGVAPAADPKTDPFGDPLPPGAVARLGTARAVFSVLDQFQPLPPDYTTALAQGYGGLARYELPSGRRLGPDGPLLSGGHLALSADGKRVAVSAFDGLTVRELDTGKVLLATKGQPLAGVSLSADGGRIVVPRMDKDALVELAVLDMATGAEVGRIGSRALGGDRVGRARGVQTNLSPDGKLLFVWQSCDPAVGTDPDPPARVWEVATGKARFAVRPGWDQSPVRGWFSPDGRWLATQTVEGRLDLWDVPAGTLARSLLRPAGLLGGVAFSPDGAVVAAAGAGGAAGWWRTAD